MNGHKVGDQLSENTAGPFLVVKCHQLIGKGLRHCRQKYSVMSALSMKRILLLGLALLSCTAHGAAQELTPRAYWPAPDGLRLLVIGYAHSGGDVLFDPSIPLYGVDSRINTAIVAYLQVFSLVGRTANVLVELPYSWGTTEGLIGKIPAQGNFSGIGDAGVTLTANLIGAPTMTPGEFQELRANPHPILGASIKVLVPLGRYDTGKLLNVGSNRWAARTELGFMLPHSPTWLLEFDGGTWLFGDDAEFISGKRQQETIFGARTHLVKRFKPGLWLSFDVNFFTGGRQTIDGERLGDVQRNSRLGATLAVPFKGRHAVKCGYSRGTVTEYGTDFRQFLVSYQVLLR